LIPLAASPDLRAFLLEREILIDETSLDAVTEKGFDRDATDHARQLVESFQQFIQDNRTRSPPCRSCSAGRTPSAAWISPRCANWPSACKLP
jgi:hypothetical protein